jgi:hypothetical protein
MRRLNGWRRGAAFAMLLSAVVPALAQDFIAPADNHVDATRAYDRASNPADLALWTSATGGRDVAIPDVYGRAGWVCRSTTDPSSGACPTSIAWHTDEGMTIIPLRFTEHRSGATVVIDVHGFQRLSWPTSPFCTNGIATQYQLSAARQIKCNGLPAAEKLLTARIPSSELRRIPFGGEWTARLHLDSYIWIDTRTAEFTADIRLDVTDNASMQVHLPELAQAAPRVDLNLRSSPAAVGAQISGAAQVEACLYDGYGSNSARFEVRMTDPGAPVPGAPGRFFVRHVERSGDDPSDRVEYEVRSRLADQAEVQHVSGDALVFHGIRDARLRLVRLPNIPEPVLCVPWSIALKAPAFPKHDRSEGYYTGVLRIEFTPSTTAP